MVNPYSFKSAKIWWMQFPSQLKLITKIRFFASFGAGGVIYLTSLIFNKVGLSATEIGLGFTLSAIIGTITRFITGNYLNKNKNIENPLKISSILGIVGSLFLIISRDSLSYLLGQSLIGAAAGIYWPTAEFAVPYLCFPINTKKAYALVRSSEALGTFLGVFIGSLLNYLIYFKTNFINDILCLIIIILLISSKKEIIKKNLNDFEINLTKEISITKNNWHKNTIIIFTSIILLTTCLALNQVILPLDFVKRSIFKDSISETITSYIISAQLILLFVLQWPIGNWLSTKERFFGIKFSLINFGISAFLLFLSNYFQTIGIYIMLIAIIFSSIGASSFLPTSSDIVFKIAPINKKGLATALLSQCFALGYLIGPLFSGRILDYYGDTTRLWILISITCFSLAIALLDKKYEVSNSS